MDASELVEGEPYAFTTALLEGSEPSLVGKEENFKFAIYAGGEGDKLLFTLGVVVDPNEFGFGKSTTTVPGSKDKLYAFRATPWKGSEPCLRGQKLQFHYATYEGKDVGDKELYSVPIIVDSSVKFTSAGKNSLNNYNELNGEDDGESNEFPPHASLANSRPAKVLNQTAMGARKSRRAKEEP